MHLRRLAMEYERWSDDDWKRAVEGDSDVAVVLDPDFKGARAAQEEFWEFCCGEEYPRGEFVQGFVQGALMIYDSVKDQI